MDEQELAPEDWVEIDLSFEDFWTWMSERLSSLLFVQGADYWLLDHEDHHWVQDFAPDGRPCLHVVRGYEVLATAAFSADQVEQIFVQPTDFGEVYRLNMQVGGPTHIGLISEEDWNTQWPEEVLAREPADGALNLCMWQFFILIRYLSLY